MKTIKKKMQEEKESGYETLILSVVFIIVLSGFIYFLVSNW